MQALSEYVKGKDVVVIWCSTISAMGKEHASHTFILLG